MPGGLTLLASANADIPTPVSGKVTVFFSLTDGVPSYKNSGGTVLPLGTTGATGSIGPMGPAIPFLFEGIQGEDGIPGPPGVAGSASAGLIGYNAYSPASNTIFSTTSSTWADIDATNMKVTFTVPASGKVLVRLSAYCDISTSVQEYFWALKVGGVDVTGSGGVSTRSADGFNTSIAFVITGLTPGASITWTWTHASIGGATGRTFAGPGLNAATASGSAGVSAAVMEVWAAP